MARLHESRGLRDRLPPALDLRVDGKKAGRLPLRATCYFGGRPRSPEVTWEPDGNPVALFVVDPDAPAGPVVHWVVPWISGRLASLPEAEPVLSGTAVGADGRVAVVQDRNGVGGWGFHPACPPAGSGSHRYFFIAWRLDASASASAARREGGAGFAAWLAEHAVAGTMEAVVLRFPGPPAT